jgi:hypothetical protein
MGSSVGKSLLDKLSPVGIALEGIGAIGSIVGAAGQYSEAKKQADRLRAFNKQQQEEFNTGYAGLEAKGNLLPTYTADVSLYNKLGSTAEMANRTAGAGQMAGTGIMREQAGQSAANAFRAGSTGARSGADLMALAALTGGQEAAQNQNINLMQANFGQQQKQTALQNYYSALGQQAAGIQREKGAEYSSMLNKSQTQLGIAQNKLSQGLALKQSAFSGEQQSMASIADANAAIWSGGGKLVSTVGKGLLDWGAQDAKMAALGEIYKTKGA